jgi:hypothetical protein
LLIAGLHLAKQPVERLDAARVGGEIDSLLLSGELSGWRVITSPN